MKTVLISNLISSVKQRNGLRKVIHIIHNFKNFWGYSESFPCCLHLSTLYFCSFTPISWNLSPFWPVFSPKYRILPTYPQSYPHYPQKYPHYPSRFYTGVIPNSIHILPRFETVFFWRVCYSILWIIQNIPMLFSGIWYLDNYLFYRIYIYNLLKRTMITDKLQMIEIRV